MTESNGTNMRCVNGGIVGVCSVCRLCSVCKQTPNAGMNEIALVEWIEGAPLARGAENL